VAEGDGAVVAVVDAIVASREGGLAIEAGTSGIGKEAGGARTAGAEGQSRGERGYR
jgi:hypothetical protein